MSHASIQTLDRNFAARSDTADLCWVDARELGVEGRGFADTEHPYDRLPARARAVVSEPVWQLKSHAAGMAVRFRTRSPIVGVRWRLRFRDLAMPHMPATGVSGVDLYADGGAGLRYAGTGVPEAFPENAARLPGSQNGTDWTFLLNLPLYNGVDALEVGVPPGFSVESAQPRRGPRPICFYGSSIVQGGCASRPGMAYPAIMGRALGAATVNLGFSGSGKGEPEMARLLADVAAAAYVLDPLPNMVPVPVVERMEYMIRELRKAHPEAPIVVVENLRPTRLPRPTGDASVEKWARVNADLDKAVDNLNRAGIGDIHRVGWLELIGQDEEATVDGLHPTDLGFMRMAQAIGKTLAERIGR